jgi:putative solute:sodium symporter small subunit
MIAFSDRVRLAQAVRARGWRGDRLPRGGLPHRGVSVHRSAIGLGTVHPAGEVRMQQRDEAHWQQTTRLMFLHLGVWLFFGYVIHFFVVPLNTITIPVLGFPLGFYMAAQGSLIVFVVQLFLFAKQQDRIDREFGVAEDD